MTDAAGVINAKNAVEVAKDPSKLAELPQYANTWPLSTYMVDSGATIDWAKLSWTKLSWTKLSWTELWNS
ncbi:MAG TPA: hypothetical protein VFC84_02690 [Desulfosporosinus sp.]|nr:hypothetical protein [Desulfosporosinus sp.]